MQWPTIAVELTDSGNNGNNADISNMFSFGFRLLEKNAEKDNGIVVSSTDCRSASIHAVHF